MFLIFFLFLADYFFYSPGKSSEKEIKNSKNQTADEPTILPIKLEEETPKEAEKTEEKIELPNLSENNEAKEKSTKSDDSLKIIPKLASWGYASSKNRLINTIIIHSSYNALGGDYYNLEKLIAEYKEYQVAPHYLIDREGRIYQLVKNQDIAYHAGESKMPDGRTGVNNFSLGIEIMNTKEDSPTESQYQSLRELIKTLENSQKINAILGHNQIAPGRKTDPWNFKWDKLKI